MITEDHIKTVLAKRHVKAMLFEISRLLWARSHNNDLYV